MEQTPLFQLNLMIWLTWSAPATSDIRPVFAEEGFHLKWIGPGVPIPLDIQGLAAAASIPMKPRPSPDLFLEHHDTQLFLPLECKLSSFGPDAPFESHGHQALQAASLLAASGTVHANNIGVTDPDAWSAHVHYVVREGHEALMHQTLTTISDRLSRAGIAAAESSAVGIAIRDDGIYLVAAPTCQVPVTAIAGSGTEGVKVVHASAGEEPSVLYLLPWDPSIGPSSDYERKVIEERIRSAVASLIGSRVEATTFTVTLNEILQESTTVWKLWADKETMKPFRRVVVSYVKTIVTRLKRYGLKTSFANGTYTFEHEAADASVTVRRFLMSKSFRLGGMGWEEESGQTAFDDLPDGF